MSSKLWNCLTVEHDFKYVLIALVICLLGCVLTTRLFARAEQAGLLQRLNWLFLSSVMAGSTIWATHFIIMMGYKVPGIASFDPWLTAFSFIVAVCASLAGLAIALYGGRTFLTEAGGAVVGLGVVSTHYTGMAAYYVQGVIVWDQRLILLSVIISITMGVIAVSCTARGRGRVAGKCGPFALVAAICLNHYVGMAAMTLEFDPTTHLHESFLSPSVVASGAIMVILALMSSGFATYRIDLQSTQQAMDRYRHLSLHDPLTGILNRVGFKEHLAGAIERARASASGLALLSIDLNRFKEINDTYGHAAGDSVLQIMAKRASATLGARDLLCRLGGDEFLAVTESYYSRADGLRFARRLQQAIAEPIEWDGHMLAVGASIGISELTPDMQNSEVLMSQADAAMYQAKSGAAASICFYEKYMDDAVLEWNALAAGMKAGLENGEFTLHYQQQNDTVTGLPVSFEVLLRWFHPQRGPVSPVEFIPIAEKTGFIVTLGEWVLRAACREAASWTNPFGIAVNVSPQQLADRVFTDRVREILTETGLDPRRLELEITESSIIGDHEHALATISLLKTMGVRIAMDDYGKGHSSLSTLQSFPFDKIKLDRSFVEGLPDSIRSDAIVRSTLILANSLGMTMLAEGVETQAQLDFLRREGCHYVQGFFFGKPEPVEGILRIVNGPRGAYLEAETKLKVAS